MGEKLTLADQALINAMGYLCTVWGEPDNIAMMLAVVRRVLPEVSASHPRIGPLADAAEAMMRSGRTGGRAENRRAYAQAKDAGAHALAKIFIHRAGEAVDRLFPQEAAS